MKAELFGRKIAGEAVFDGAAAVVNLVTTVPTWTSAANAAAWKALFDKPTFDSGLQQYVTGLHLRVSGAPINVSLAGATPSAVDGIEWPAPYEREFPHAPDLIRSAKFFLPAGCKLHVTLFFGQIG